MPVTKKITESGTTSCSLPYGVSSMQGWRTHMEDEHICETTLVVAVESSSSSSSASSPSPSSSTETTTTIPLPNVSLFAVLDGHRGNVASRHASRHFVKNYLSRQPSLRSYATLLRERNDDDDSSVECAILLERSLSNAFREYDADLYRLSKEKESNDDDDDDVIRDGDGWWDGSGTTAVMVAITPRWIVCANAGDSRAVLARRGAVAAAAEATTTTTTTTRSDDAVVVPMVVVPLSYDHKPTVARERTRIENAGGFVKFGRVDGDLAVSRGFGDFFLKVTEEDAGDYHKGFKRGHKVSCIPDIIRIRRRNDLDQFVILACDGIWDVQSNEQCVRMVQEIFNEGEQNVANVCEEVLDLCLKKGSLDNMTALIIKMPACVIGNGGGVLARREQRDAEQREKWGNRCY